MPTLLSINNYYYLRGGAESVFLAHNRMFEEHGWTVVPFAMKHPKNFDTPWARYFVEEIEFGSEYSFFQKVRRAPKIVYSLEARRKLSKLLDTIRPDVCHAHNLYHHISPSILSLLKQRSIPTVLTLHDLKIACPAYNMLARDGICERCKGGRLHNVLIHRCIKKSTTLSAVVFLESLVHRVLSTYSDCVSRFVVPSRFYIDKLTEWSMPQSKFRYVPNFVDVDRLQPSYLPGKAFLYFGRLSPEKGVKTLIHAAAIARCPVWIAGTGPQEPELRQLAADVSADVTFLGYQTGPSLHKAVHGARAVVLPSEWYENAPMSILESYSLGTPVIGARIGGIPELIREGETGLTFPSGDADLLASVMRNVANQSDESVERMGRAARAWVESEFTAEIYRQRILDCYEELGVSRPPNVSSNLTG